MHSDGKIPSKINIGARHHAHNSEKAYSIYLYFGDTLHSVAKQKIYTTLHYTIENIYLNRTKPLHHTSHKFSKSRKHILNNPHPPPPPPSFPASKTKLKPHPTVPPPYNHPKLLSSHLSSSPPHSPQQTKPNQLNLLTSTHQQLPLPNNHNHNHTHNRLSPLPHSEQSTSRT